MRQSKKVTALLVVMLLTAGAAGCGETTESQEDSLEEEQTWAQGTVEMDRATETDETAGALQEDSDSAMEGTQTADPQESGGVDWGEFAFSSIQKQIMRLKTGIYDRELTPEDLLTVTELEVNGNYLWDAGWISYLKNLTTLKLPCDALTGNIDNLDFLAGLVHLKELDLGGAVVNGTGYWFRDISGLSGLTELTSLSLLCNGSCDVDVLSDLKGLTTLTLGNFNPDDLGVLSGLTNLTSLTLHFDRRSGDDPDLDLSPLAGLTNLNTLVLSGSGYSLKDISFLSDMKELTTLVVVDNSSGDRGGDFGLDTPDLGVLAGLTKLEKLELGFNIDTMAWREEGRANYGYDLYTYDLSPLSGLLNLKSLRLGYYTYYSDLSVLSGLSNLEELNLHYPSSIWGEGDNLVAYGGDLSGLGGLTNLRTLILRGGWDVNQVASLPALPNLTTLSVRCEEWTPYTKERLRAAGVDYLDGPLSNLQNLTTLIWSGTWGMKDFQLPNLTTLIIEGNDMDMAVSSGGHCDWSNLTTLVLPKGILDGRNDSEIGWRAEWNAYFPNLTDLTLVGFSGAQDNLSALSGLPKLTSLTLKNEGYGSALPLPKLPELPNLTDLTLIGYDGEEAELSHLSNLTTVTVSRGGTSSIFPYKDCFSYKAFSGLTNLKTVLGVYRDFEEIATFPNLEAITFPYEYIKNEQGDISLLHSLPDIAVSW